MSSTVDGLAGVLVGGLEAQASIGAVAVVVPQPVAHGDGDVVVVMEPPPVGELSAEAGVVGLDDPVLPRAARIDVEGLDAVGGHELLDGLGDELGAVVGPDVLGLGLLPDHGLEEDAGHVLDHLLLLPDEGRIGGRQQVQLVPPTLQGAWGDVHLLADLGGRPASVLLLDGPDPGLLGVVLVAHYGGVVGYFGVVVNTPRKLHSAGPTNRDYPNKLPDLG